MKNQIRNIYLNFPNKHLSNLPILNTMNVDAVGFESSFHLIIDRVLDSFEKERIDGRKFDQLVYGHHWKKDGWGGCQHAVIKALEKRNKNQLFKIFKNFFRTNYSYGLAMGKQELDMLLNSKENKQFYSSLWRDKFISLAIALGVLKLPNPEISPKEWSKVLLNNPETLATEFEKVSGIPFSFPAVFNPFGINVKGNVFPLIAFHYYYLAASVNLLFGVSNKKIIEIGGGFGGVAYFFLKLKPSSYNIFDLSYGCAIQAVYLQYCFPDIPIRLYGEPAPSASTWINIQPSWLLLNEGIEIGNIDLAINQDSLADIDRPIAAKYLQKIRQKLTGQFISVGPDYTGAGEKGFTCSVNELVREQGGFKLIDRMPFITRKGYFREIYYPVK
jgi:putative sugar O-methyltransferase